MSDLNDEQLARLDAADMQLQSMLVGLEGAKAFQLPIATREDPESLSAWLTDAKVMLEARRLVLDASPDLCRQIVALIEGDASDSEKADDA